MQGSKSLFCFRILSVLLVSFCISLATPESDNLCKQIAETPGDTTLLAKLKTAISSTTDVDLRARLSIIYCLGCIYVGNTKEAADVSSYLNRKYPDDPNLKYLSKEYITDTCAVCGGTGSVQTNCTSCNGSGKCSVCKGSGTTTIDHVGGGRETVKCPRCHGSGKCQQCNGTGTVNKSCADCNGTGYKLSRSKVKNVYVALLKGQTPADISSPASKQLSATSDTSTRTASTATPSKAGYAYGAEVKVANQKANSAADLSDYMSSKLSHVPLDPKVYVSQHAKDLHFTYSFIGKDLAAYKTCLKGKDWNGLAKLVCHGCGAFF